MIFSAPIKDVVALVQRACGVVDKRSTMPVLANCLITAEGSTVTVTASDLYLQVVGSAGATVKEPGSVCLPAGDLLSRLKMLPAGEVTFKADAKCSVEVKGGSGPRRYRLFGIPGDQFPPVATLDGSETTHEIPSDVLRSVIGRTEMAVSTDSTRPHLNSLLAISDGARVSTVSTDGHRLQYASESCVSGAFEVMIPLKGVTELRKMLDGATGAVGVSFKAGNVTFAFPWGTYTAKLTQDATFPPWRQVIPQTFGARATTNRAVLIDAVRAVGIAAAERSGGIKLAFDSGTLIITAEGPETGTGSDEVPADFTGEAMKLGVNASYLLAALQCCAREGLDEVLLEMNGPLNPVLVSAVGDREMFQGVVMPLRI